VTEIAAAATPVFAELGNDKLISSLFHQTIAVLSGGGTHGAAGSNRANTIAARLLESHGAPPPDGIFLGDEALLSERLGCTRPALREALRVLADLSILKVRRGRGGGFTLVRPSQDAIVRRAFGLIASRHPTMAELVPALWALDLIRLRLAMRHLRRLEDQVRQRQCDELAALLTSGTEPVRWYHLQRALDRIANNGVLSVIAESFTYYLARLNQTDAIWREAIRRWNEIDASMHETESALIQALRADDAAAAEQIHLQQHNLISWVIDGPRLRGSLTTP
jgi:DNA-binding FadR family transcriptional regulator